MNKLYSMLGLAMRAGKIASGAFQTQKALIAGQAWLIVLDESMSEAELEDYSKTCSRLDIPLIMLPEGKLETAIGKPGRKAAAITDENFARQIINLSNGGAQ